MDVEGTDEARSGSRFVIRVTDEPGVASGEETPVRPGRYGERVIAVEPGGAEYIPEPERHGSPRRLFWTWGSPNLEFATIFLGVIPVAVFGGGFWPTVAATLVGSAAGAAILGLLSTWGPAFGVPQLVHSRGAFGYRGNFLPAGLNALSSGIGWFAVNSLSGTFAFSTLTHLPTDTSLVIVIGVQVTAAFVGHNFIHQFQKTVFPVLAVVFCLASIVVLAQSHPADGFNPNAPAAFGGPTGAFSIALFVTFAYVVGWVPYAMDYARYLPPTTGRGAAFWSAALGAFLPCALLTVVGAGLATVAGTAWGPTDNPTDQLASALPPLLASLVLLGITIGSVSANVLNIYSGALSFLALGIRVRRVRLERALVTAGLSGVGYVVARLGETDVGRSYENFLLLIGYWIMPFLAVVCTDFWLRRGHYRVADFYARNRNSADGVLAMLAGIALSVPFWNQAAWRGPIAAALPQLGDLSFLVGFGGAAVVYYAFARSRGLPQVKRQAETT